MPTKSTGIDVRLIPNFGIFPSCFRSRYHFFNLQPSDFWPRHLIETVGIVASLSNVVSLWKEEEGEGPEPDAAHRGAEPAD